MLAGSGRRLGPSGWSGAARFSTGVLSPAEWRGAAFLGGSAVPSAAGYVFGSGSLLRRDLALPTDDPPVAALAHLAACGLAQLSLNGVAAGGGRRALEPPLSQVEVRLLYVTQDVASLLRAGNNTIGIALGRGFW